MRPARPCNWLLSPSSSSCPRANGRPFCSATCLVGPRLKPHRYSVARQPRSTALSSERARHLPNAIPMADRRSHPGPVPRNKSFSAAICRLGKGMIWMASWPSSKRTRPAPCRRGSNGMRSERLSGPSLRWLGRPVVAFDWAPQQPTGGQHSSFTNALAHPRSGPHSIHVLTLDDDRISALTLFVPPTGPQLFPAFGLPLTLPDVAIAELPHPVRWHAQVKIFTLRRSLEIDRAAISQAIHSSVMMTTM